MDKPKHKSENDEYIELVRKVKEEKSEEAFEKIAKALHTYLQHLSIKKFRIAGTNSDDIYQEGLMALSTKAIPDYRKEKGAFLSFAKLCIRRHIITVLKATNNNKNKALNGSVSMDSPSDASDDEEGQVPVSWHLDTGQESVVDEFLRHEDFHKHKKELKARLTKLEAEVLELYLQNMSYAEMAKEMNKHRRGGNRVDTKVNDNGLQRCKSKCHKMLQELAAEKLEEENKARERKRRERVLKKFRF